MRQELISSQKFYSKRTALWIKVQTDEVIKGWGECFGPGNIVIANKGIAENVIKPMVLGSNPLDRDIIWHKVYNLLRDHGQKDMFWKFKNFLKMNIFKLKKAKYIYSIGI